MCTIPYQKCVCFVFLVLLAVLSCSGFRIDNLAMTDVSKRNSHATTSAGLLEALFANSTHRLRHRRHQVLQTRRRFHQCPDFDVSWKAYAADAIAVATIESTKSNCTQNCMVQFKIHKWLKKRRQQDKEEVIRLDFRTNRNGCEYDDITSPKYKPYLKTNNTQSKRYILFLKIIGRHNFTAAFAPEINKNKTYKIVSKVIASQFRPRSVKVDKIHKIETRPKRLKLSCKVRGLPVPIITWRYNNITIQHSNRTRITQKKRKSTLTIRNPEWGQYQCVAQDVNGKLSNSSIEIRKPCEERYRYAYCSNGGTCFQVDSMGEMACECPEGFTGDKCEQKSADQSIH